MSYPCICRIVCHIHGTMWRATLEYAKANRRYAIHRTIQDGWPDEHYRIAVCASPDAHRTTRSSYTVTSLRVTLSRDFSPERHPAVRHIHVNMFHQWILGCFCPAFQQLGYETDHLPPYSTQIRNVVPCIHALTHYFLYIYLIMFFSPFSCSLQLHSPKFFPSLTLCSQTPSAYWKFIKYY